MTKAPLRVLYLEDDPMDHEIMRSLVEKAGISCEFTYAMAQADYAAALRQGGFDLVFADYTLPGYDGLSALSLAQQLAPEVPFIFVSGTIGEERAIESLKSGATDYVLKHNLERLPPAILRARQEVDERTRRKQAEEARRQAEARFRDFFENAVEGMFQATPEGRFLSANPALARICGYESPAELMARVQDIGRQLYADPGRWEALKRLLADRGKVLAFESQLRCQDGRIIWISENTRAVRDAQGRVLHYEGAIEDITTRQEAAEALRRSEGKFREMAENIRDVFWSSTPDAQQILYVSPAYEQIWGRPVADLLARPSGWLEALVPEDRGRVLAALEQLAKGVPYRMEYRLNRPDGTQRWIEDRGFPVLDQSHRVVRMVGLATDITERKQLEAQLLQAQKMEVVGQLAGGMAHDFNNILTVISGHVNLLLDDPTLTPEIQESLKIVYTGSERAAGLIRQLLVFSRRQAIQRRLVDLNEVVEETAKMLRRLIGEQIKLELGLCPHPPFIQADPGMIEQVLLNLAVNAQDAMPNGGQLTIQIAARRLAKTEARRSPEARPGDFICLRVSDTGRGIPPEVRPRIFEPFFTTKEPGRGTGLGLAMVLGIVKQHEGWLEVESQVNAGTTFNVFLPAAPPEVVTAQARQTATQVARGRETILLVEDETAVREFAAAVLQRHGYVVLQARSGAQALGVWQRHAHRIDLLFTDMVMPDGVTGPELAEKLLAEKPALKVIFTSGYSGEAMEQVFAVGKEIRFLQKPYLPWPLALAVRTALDDPPKK